MWLLNLDLFPHLNYSKRAWSHHVPIAGHGTNVHQTRADFVILILEHTTTTSDSVLRAISRLDFWYEFRLYEPPIRRGWKRLEPCRRSGIPQPPPNTSKYLQGGEQDQTRVQQKWLWRLSQVCYPLIFYTNTNSEQTCRVLTQGSWYLFCKWIWNLNSCILQFSGILNSKENKSK